MTGRLRLLGLLACLVQPSWGAAQETYYFGQSAPYTGSAAALGTQVREGILAAFAECNRQGGLHGIRLELVAIDDEYEPRQTLENAHTLMADKRVLAIVGTVGTSTSLSMLDVTKRKKLALVAPVSGAPVFRTVESQQAGVLNVRASYTEEISALVQQLVASGNDRIALLYQDDAFGRVGLEQLTALSIAGKMRLTGSATYLRNTPAIKMPLLHLTHAVPDAYLLLSTSDAAASFVKWARKLGINKTFSTLSFTGSHVLANALDGQVMNVYMSQVTPSPHGDLPLTRRFRNALAQQGDDIVPGHLAFEGYIAGRVVIELIRLGGHDRASFLRAVLDLDQMSLDGTQVFNRNNSQPIHLSKGGADGIFDVFAAM